MLIRNINNCVCPPCPNPRTFLSVPDGSRSSDHLHAALHRRQRRWPGHDFPIDQLEFSVVLLPPRLPQDRQLPENITLPSNRATADVLEREAAGLRFLKAGIAYKL